MGYLVWFLIGMYIGVLIMSIKFKKQLKKMELDAAPYLQKKKEDAPETFSTDSFAENIVKEED